MAISEQEVTRDPRRRQLLIIGGVVLVLLIAVWFLFLRGGDEPAEPAAAVPAIEEPAEPEPLPSDPSDGDGGGGAVETFEVFASRDPFEPLVSDTVGSGGSTSGATTGGDSTSTFIGGGSGNSGDAGDSGGGSGSGSSNVGGHRVRVVDVYRNNAGRPTAQVEVDGTVYTAQEGETFADNFQLVSASGRCATMLFGDDQFTLCEGEEILK